LRWIPYSTTSSDVETGSLPKLFIKDATIKCLATTISIVLSKDISHERFVCVLVQSLSIAIRIENQPQ